MEVLTRQRLFALLVEKFEHDSEEVRTQICEVLAKMARVFETMPIEIVIKRYDLLPSLITLLDSDDWSAVLVSLECLRQWLQIGEKRRSPGASLSVVAMGFLEGGGIKVLQKIESGECAEMSLLVETILGNYFVGHESWSTSKMI